MVKVTIYFQLSNLFFHKDLGLFIIYSGLIFVGALYNSQFEEGISRTDLLSGLANKTLGNIGSTFWSVLVTLACFTTAVAIIVSIADFFKVYLFDDQVPFHK